MGVRFLREISPKRGLDRKGSRPWLEVDIVRTIASIMQSWVYKNLCFGASGHARCPGIKAERDRCYGMEEFSSYEVSWSIND